MSATSTSAPPPIGFRAILLRATPALACGTAGGFLWAWLGWPLPFIVGAMAGGVVAGLLPLGAAVPAWLRQSMAVVIGVMVGSSFTPTILAGAAGWIPTLTAITVYTFAAVGLGFVLFRYVGRYDPVTSYCMSAPGGFIEMIVLAGSLGADPRQITLVHTIRLIGVVLLLPVVMPSVPVAANAFAATVQTMPGAADWLIFLACGSGALIANRLNIPGAIMVGPLVLSAAAHMSGLTEAKLPQPMMIAAQIVVGSAVGCSIVALNPRALLKASLFGVLLTALLLLLSLCFALGITWLTARPFATAFLLFAPGGLPEMSLIALSLNIEPAMISTHHLLRLVLIVTVVPLLLRPLLSMTGAMPVKEPPK